MMCSTDLIRRLSATGSAAALLAGVVLWGATAQSAAAENAEARAPAGVGGYELDVGVGKSQVLETPGSYTDLMVGDPKVADVVPLTTHSVYVVGKSVGSTSLSIYGPGKHLIAAVDVVVDPDAGGLRGRIHEVLPDEHDISVRGAGQSIILSGTVGSPAALHQIAELADSYAPGKVINMLGVEGTQEVQLEVRFVEMERTAARAFDFNMSWSAGNGSGVSFGNTGPQNVSTIFPSGGLYTIPGTVSGVLGTANVFGFTSKNFSAQLDALETKGITKTLAEPTLVAMSGETASFLAGGEIPIPAPQTSGAGVTPVITIQYQQYGVSLAFTPTILGDGMINLVVKPEVSSIDTTNAIVISGITIPALKVSRASTTVELRDGESFVIAGLLSDDYKNQISQVPYLGSIPILGALFHSPSFQKDQTELVIVVTPHLAVARRGHIALPTDHFTPPSDYELFLFGMLAGQGANLRPEDRALLSQDPAKGGVEGPYGHVLY
jgi:pilus assembly protein CpaC